MSRASGILLHPTSLPGPFGIGELGSEAYAFVDWLVAAGQAYWQTLPLGPTGYGDSPYASFSAFAGNPMLISIEKLLEEGLLTQNEAKNAPVRCLSSVDFGPLIIWKTALLKTAYHRWTKKTPAHEIDQFTKFCAEQCGWLPEFALFMALKDDHNLDPWNDWEEPLKLRDTTAIEQARQQFAEEIKYQSFVQYKFFQQWWALRYYANSRGVKLIGDIPIFVAYDSADTWTNLTQFYVDEKGSAIYVAGVPPDYFSETGQRWGNPLYRWEVMAENGYQWWVERFRQCFRLVDVVRIDHFRGFSAYWEVPAEELTAVKGRWVQGPGIEVFKAVEKALGKLPIIAEDLGVITPEVEQLLEDTGYPGMRVLQFAFGGGAENSYLPHNYTRNSVVYSGTHDNDTTEGWYCTAPKAEQNHLIEYSDCDIPSQALIKLAMSSVADFAIMPLQDVMGLGTEARMNVPGTTNENWRWRFEKSMLTDELASNLRDLTALYGRIETAAQISRK